MRRYFAILFLFMILILITASRISAYCNPPECEDFDSNGNLLPKCPGVQVCSAKCCVDPGGSGGVSATPAPGGGSCPWTVVNCPSGTVKDTSQLLYSQCGGSSQACTAGTAQTQDGSDANCCRWISSSRSGCGPVTPVGGFCKKDGQPG